MNITPEIYSRLRTSCFRITGRINEDTIQETLLKALTAKNQFVEREATLPTYLHKIMTNVIRDEWKKDSKIEIVPIEDEDGSLSNILPSNESIGYIGTLVDVERTLNKLHPIYSSIVKMVADGYNLKEIAAALGPPHSWIKFHLFILRRFLNNLNNPQQVDNTHLKDGEREIKYCGRTVNIKNLNKLATVVMGGIRNLSEKGESVQSVV